MCGLAIVRVSTCDSSDLSDMLALVRSARLNGVLHAAGAGDKGLMIELAPQRIAWMYGQKSFGAWYLHCTTPTAPLDTLVLFSSVGSGLATSVKVIMRLATRASTLMRSHNGVRASSRARCSGRSLAVLVWARLHMPPALNDRRYSEHLSRAVRLCLACSSRLECVAACTCRWCTVSDVRALRIWRIGLSHGSMS